MPIEALSRDPTPLQQLLAVVVPVVFWALLLIGFRALKYAGLQRTSKRAVARIREQLATLDPYRLEIPDRDADSLDDYRSELHTLARGEGSSAESPRDAASRILSSWQDRTSPVARLSLYLAGEAITLAVLAIIVIVPTAVLRDVLETGDAPSWAVITGAAGSTWTALVDAVALFPATNVLWALALTGVIQLYDTLYTYGFEIAVVLGVGAIAINTLDAKTDDRLAPRLYPRRLRTLQQLAAGSLLVWLSGVLPALAGNALGYPTIGALVGGGIATIAALCGGVLVGIGFRERLRSTVADLTADGLPATQAGTPIESDRNLAVAYLLVRKAGAALGVLMLPVLPMYLVTAVTSGALTSKVAVVAGASLLVQVALVVTALALVSFVVAQDASDWQRALTAARSAMSRHAVRAYLFARAGPAIIFTAVFAFAVLLGVPLFVGAAAGVTAAVGGKLLWTAWQRASFRLHTKDREPTTPTYLSLAIGTITTADGDVHVGRVGRTWLAWPDRDELIDEMLRFADQRFTDGTVPQSIMRAFYSELNEQGESDPVAVVKSRRVVAQRTADSIVADEARIDDVTERLDERFDERVWRAAVEALEEDGKLSRENGRYRWHGPSIGDRSGVS